MYDLRALGLAMMVVLPVGAAGQALDTARLHHRADSLLVLWRQANTLALAQQAVRDVRHQRATQVSRTTAAIRGENPVQAGDLMVIADYPDSIPLREAATRAWSILYSTYGHRASSLVQQPIHLTVVFSVGLHIPAANARRVPHSASVGELERTLLGLAGQPAIDRRLSNWLGNTVQPVFDTSATRSNVYVQLVTAGSIAARNCFQGSQASCVTALQLSEDSDFFLTAFDAAERRQAVARSSARSRIEPADLPAFTHCVDDRVDSACVVFLRALGWTQIPRPLGVEARNLLVSTALEVGGAGAFDRLTGDSAASVSERLSRTAGAPIDRVVQTWRSNVMAARPPRSGVPLGAALLTLGWAGLFATGAARSTRWRLS
jgi:hypothetical protein